jgi:hypothetical protein
MLKKWRLMLFEGMLGERLVGKNKKPEERGFKFNGRLS